MRPFYLAKIQNKKEKLAEKELKSGSGTKRTETLLMKTQEDRMHNGLVVGSSFNTILIWKYVLHINTLKVLKNWRKLEEISFGK